MCVCVRNSRDTILCIYTCAGTAGLSTVAAAWAYDGWADLNAVAEEITRPERNLLWSVVGGTICVSILYLLTNAAYLAVLSGTPLLCLSVSLHFSLVFRRDTLYPVSVVHTHQ